MLQNLGPTICLWLEEPTPPSHVKSRTATRLKPREAPGADPRSASPEETNEGLPPSPLHWGVRSQELPLGGGWGGTVLPQSWTRNDQSQKARRRPHELLAKALISNRCHGPQETNLGDLRGKDFITTLSCRGRCGL